MLGALGSTANARAGGAQGKEAHPHVIGDVSRPVPAKARSAAPLALHVLHSVLDHQPISSGDPLVDMGHAGDGTGGHQHMVLVGDEAKRLNTSASPPTAGSGSSSPGSHSLMALEKGHDVAPFRALRARTGTSGTGAGAVARRQSAASGAREQERGGSTTGRHSLGGRAGTKSAGDRVHRRRRLAAQRLTSG